MNKEEMKDYIEDLERENNNLKEEIEVLSEDLDAAEERVENARQDGYDEALELAERAIEELMYKKDPTV